MGLIGFFAFLGTTFLIGSYFEKKHFEDIRQREKATLKLPAVTIKNVAKNEDVSKSRLVQGSVVVSLDYFKRAIAGLTLIFGGRIVPYETLLDRARREAILRMKAMAAGADIIANVRIETSAIGGDANSGGKKKQIGSIEAIAYGTAITLKK
jgi:uncharacterized protein YbjQ (UPF0145 family)